MNLDDVIKELITRIKGQSNGLSDEQARIVAATLISDLVIDELDGVTFTKEDRLVNQVQ